MDQRLGRLAALLASAALMRRRVLEHRPRPRHRRPRRRPVPRRGHPPRHRPRRPRTRASPRRPPRSRATSRAPSPATSRSAGTAASARATRPSRSTSSRRSPRTSTPRTRASTCASRPYPYQLARDTLAVQLASGNRTDIVGPVGIGGANAFHGQWLDLQPLIDKNHYDMTQLPGEHRRAVQRRRARARPGSRSPSTRRRSSTRRACSRRPASPSRRTSGTAPTRCPTARPSPWDYDTVRKLAMMLTVDKNGKDATEAGFDPEQHRPVGLRAAARRPPPGAAPIGRPARSPRATARPSRSRTPGRRPGTAFYDGIWKDHFSVDRAEVPRHGLQPRAAIRSSPARSR